MFTIQRPNNCHHSDHPVLIACWYAMKMKTLRGEAIPETSTMLRDSFRAPLHDRRDCRAAAPRASNFIF
jgi:hypothetical protein